MVLYNNNNNNDDDDDDDDDNNDIHFNLAYMKYFEGDRWH